MLGGGRARTPRGQPGARPARALTSGSTRGPGAGGSSRCHRAGPPAAGCSRRCCRTDSVSPASLRAGSRPIPGVHHPPPRSALFSPFPGIQPAHPSRSPSCPRARSAACGRPSPPDAPAPGPSLFPELLEHRPRLRLRERPHLPRRARGAAGAGCDQTGTGGSGSDRTRSRRARR